MEIAVVGRATDISDSFRDLVNEKLDKAIAFAPNARRIDVVVTHERNPRQADRAERLEITLWGKGPVVRAEASASDRAAALDLALGKLLERLRRARDRRKNHHENMPLVPVDVRPVLDRDDTAETADAGRLKPPPVGEVAESTLGDSPVLIRQKTHQAQPMSLDDALYEMELVGHDFFLFVEEDSGMPAVAYRRRGWSYGVIRLDAQVEA